MTFLSPLFLLLGVGAAVPLLIHLLRRRLDLQLEFPAVRYLLRAEQENRRTLRLRNLLLMMLRVLAVLLLSLAAARPIGRMIGVGQAPAALAIVVDNTMSSGAVVGGRSMLDRFKRAASSLSSDALPTDHLWLVTADGRVVGGTPAVIRNAIGSLQPSSADGNLAGAIRRAAGLTGASPRSSRVVVVLTDGQRASWPAAVQLPDVRVVVWSPAVSPPDNHAVLLAEARPIRWTPRGEIVARFQARDSVTYRVTIAGKTFARGTAAPNQDVLLPAAPSERGWVSGSIDLSPDELTADDSRYFAVWIGSPPAAYATPDAGEFTSAAVDALRASGRIAPGNAVAIGPADEVQRLPALLTAPADPVHLGAANRALERLGVPWRFGARRTQAVDATGAGVGSVPVSDRYELVAQAGAEADTLAAAARAPWIVSGPRYVLIGSPLVASATGLPVRAAFLPWLASTIGDRLSGEPGTVVAGTPGSVLARPAGADHLEQPDGSRVELADSVRIPTNPGVYFLMSGGRRAGAVVVNPPVSESRLDRLSTADLGALLRGARVVDEDQSSSIERESFRAASTRSLLFPVLVVALLMLVAESLVVAGRRRMA